MDETICPKCLTPYPASMDSCPKCGLVPAHWDEGREKESRDSGPAGPLDEAAEALWQRLLTEPENEAGHRDFLAHCRDHHMLDYAAWRYRDFLRRDPHSGLGVAYRDKIIRMAQILPLPAKRAAARTRGFKGIKILLALGLGFMLLALFTARLLFPA